MKLGMGIGGNIHWQHGHSSRLATQNLEVAHPLASLEPMPFPPKGQGLVHIVRTHTEFSHTLTTSQVQHNYPH